ncbi:hypothetical protein AB0O52_20545 [Arthrobacter sp. NPDC080073]|uniref:hypothetical protein n=1 Tax=Arthrobacter sp. NPDC080073 TaxID=3155919 RepID=UPI0034457844
MALAIMIGATLGAAAPSQAATTYCGNGACTLYLNWNETNSLANWRPPQLNIPDPRLYAAYVALAAAHVFIAKGWVWRGDCVGFTINIRPWATQGMFGWRCR